MSEQAQQILVLLVFAVVCAGINAFGRSWFVKITTLILMFGGLGLAAWLIVEWVLS